MNLNIKNCALILLSATLMNGSINAMDGNITIINNDTDIANDSMSLANVQEILESFGKTQSVTNQQKEFIKNIAEVVETYSNSEIVDVLQDCHYKLKKAIKNTDDEYFYDNTDKKLTNFNYYFFDYSELDVSKKSCK